VVVPGGQGCCGALSWHTGRGDAAQKFARQLMACIPKDVDCFLTTAAGCGSAVAEYPLLLAGTDAEGSARSFAAKTMDISVYLSQLDLEDFPRLQKPKRVAYHDACHLAHAQGVRAEPRKILSLIPNLEVAEIEDADTCCGSAGTYNIEQPDIANQLGRRKAEAIIKTGASAVITGNIGCLVQIEKHLRSKTDRVAVLHTVQVLDLAYRAILC
jgi:glycolate oxidase iron-sulfur subunit